MFHRVELLRTEPQGGRLRTKSASDGEPGQAASRQRDPRTADTRAISNCPNSVNAGLSKLVGDWREIG